MIKLYGFPLSNYFNKVKFVLLEHDIPFEEVRVNFGQDEATLARSPLGKVPYIDTDAGPLCESQVIVEYLASAYPDKPIFSADPYRRREGARTGGVHRSCIWNSSRAICTSRRSSAARSPTTRKRASKNC